MVLAPQMHFLSDPERSIPHRRGRAGLSASRLALGSTQTQRLGSPVGPDQAAPLVVRWSVPHSLGRSDAKSFRGDEARAPDDDRECGSVARPCGGSLEADKSRLESEKLRAAVHLAQLRGRLERHFLLNTLNAIAGLVTAEPREARCLLIESNGPGLPKGEARTGACGIIAVRQRLALKYGDRAALRLESTPTGTRAIVELPGQRMDPARTLP